MGPSSEEKYFWVFNGNHWDRTLSRLVIAVSCLILRHTAAAKSLQSCLTLCNPRDGSLPGSPSLGFSRQEYWSGVPLPSLSVTLLLEKAKFLTRALNAPISRPLNVSVTSLPDCSAYLAPWLFWFFDPLPLPLLISVLVRFCLLFLRPSHLAESTSFHFQLKFTSSECLSLIALTKPLPLALYSISQFKYSIAK